MPNSKSIIITFIFAITSDCVSGVYHGRIAEMGDYKYSVHLYTSDREICGGSIITVNHILTAGHCVYQKEPVETIVSAGTNQVYDEEGIVFRDVIDIKIHEGYKPPAGNVSRSLCRRCLEIIMPCIWEPQQFHDMDKNDIAVLTLDQPLPINEYIDIIAYKPAPKQPFKCPCDFAGWGRVNYYQTSLHLRYTELVILTPAECKAKNAEHRSNEFCAIDPNRRNFPMNGDSGSALVCYDVAVGVLSTGTANVDYPPTFTKIADHVKFIDKAIDMTTKQYNL